MATNMTVKDCKPLVEKVCTNLKDIDERWLEFDQAPRIHANPVFSHIYQMIYRRLVKQPAPKDAKPPVKKEKEPAANEIQTDSKLVPADTTEKPTKQDAVVEMKRTRAQKAP